MATQHTLDQAKLEAFMGKAIGDLSGSYAVAMCTIGDRHGLFKDLAAHGPATSVELAARTGLNERYLREWLSGLTTAGYLEHDATSGRFTLPPEQAAALAEEAGEHFLGGVYHMIPAFLGAIDGVADAFQHGGGVTQAQYRPDFWDGLERFTASWFENQMLQDWLPKMPDVQARLERGATMADVGCGRGRAAIKLAQAFPSSRFVGYDNYEPTIAIANASAAANGVADQVRFEARDVSKGIPEQYDVIATFDVVHDAVDPLGLLRSIRQGLKPDGIYVLLDVNAAETLEGNAGPLGTFFYGASLFYCMTTSLAHDGEGLGTAGLPESKVRELCAEAGFGTVRRVEIENIINSLYEIRP
jgi:2-polyprenyl-3-methyl-5-hydroxy-6-metoxy-1,4-benzoquinol methylase